MSGEKCDPNDRDVEELYFRQLKDGVNGMSQSELDSYLRKQGIEPDAAIERMRGRLADTLSKNK